MTSAFRHIATTQQPVKVDMITEGKVGARLVTFRTGLQAVMKLAEKSAAKKQSQTKQYGIEIRSLPKREVAFYELSKLLGFEVVPETVLGTYEGETASYQQYVRSVKVYEIEPKLKDVENEDQWVVAFRELMRQFPEDDVTQLTLLDFLACARDRHGANYGARLDVKDSKARWRLIGWDNGVAFGETMERYHCVAHKYLYRFSFNFSKFWDKLEHLRHADLQDALEGLIEGSEIEHVWLRLQFLLAYPQRLPWHVLSQGAQSPSEFPSYASYFKPMCPDEDRAKTAYVLQISEM